MSQERRRIVLWIACVALVLGARDLSADVNSEEAELKLLQGRWRVESTNWNGEQSPIKLGDITFRGNEYTLILDGRPFVYRIKLYPERKPKEFEAWILGTPKERLDVEKGPVRGLYELERGLFRRCYSPVGGAMPKKMESPPGEGLMFTEHRSADDSDEAAEAEIP